MEKDILRLANKFYKKLKIAQSNENICSLCKINCSRRYHATKKEDQLAEIILLLREKNIPAYMTMHNYFDIFISFPGGVMKTFISDQKDKSMADVIALEYYQKLNNLSVII